MVKKVTYARLSPLAKGRLIGLYESGLKRSDVLEQVHKKDGTSAGVRTLSRIVKRFQDDPEWDGVEHRDAGGRPRDVTEAQEKKILKILVRDVGKCVVSANYVRKLLPEIRHVRERTVQRTFHRLGYDYLYRRNKAAIGSKYKPDRLKYCDWLLKQDQLFLNKFAYVDGTTFFLPRTEEEQRDKERAALGPRGWRLADGSDGLEDANIGPSAYAKCQGISVRI